MAWLSLRQGRTAEAKTGFEQQIGLYPVSAEVPAALYWRGRLAEEDKDPGTARAYYQKLSERFRNFYYGELARRRLKEIGPNDDPPQIALLDRVPGISAGTNITTSEPPTDNLRYQKAQVLQNGGLLDFAVRELQAAGREDTGNWVTAETREALRGRRPLRRRDSGLQTRRAELFRGGFAHAAASLLGGIVSQALLADLKKFSSQNALDPYLVASLIRQESEFNPGAVSRANALGLMQLLPKVGSSVAKTRSSNIFLRRNCSLPRSTCNWARATSARWSISLATFEYALAAYNAGSNRVDDWLGQGKYRDPQEFVESIPFTETREYVQAILRNANVYRQLYGAP